MNSDYLVSWTDKFGNEFNGEFQQFNDALELFYSISGSEENKVDYDQVSSELWSDADNKTILRYDYATNRYYQM